MVGDTVCLQSLTSTHFDEFIFSQNLPAHQLKNKFLCGETKQFNQPENKFANKVDEFSSFAVQHRILRSELNPGFSAATDILSHQLKPGYKLEFSCTFRPKMVGSSFKLMHIVKTKKEDGQLLIIPGLYPSLDKRFCLTMGLIVPPLLLY